MRRPLKIALFGGTFDPPHRAHHAVATAAREELGLDQVWWIPAKHPPHKVRGIISPYQQRMAMVKLAVMDRPEFVVSDVEGRYSGPSYTVNTVRSVCHDHPQDAFWLLIGEDSLHQFSTWYAPERIAALVPLIVYRRQGSYGRSPIPEYLNGRIQYCSASPVTVSAEEVRQRVSEGSDINHLVSEPVRTYIAAHHLYHS